MDRSKNSNQKRKNVPHESRTAKKSRQDKSTQTVLSHSAAPETENPETAELSVDTTGSPKEGGSSGTSIMCTICMDTLSVDDLKDHMEDNDEVDWTEWQKMDLQPTFCGHVFHSLCLRRWLKVEPFCPVCRDPVNPDPFLLPDRIPVHAPETGNPETAELPVDMAESPKKGDLSTSVVCTICMDTLSVDDLQDHMEDNDDGWMKWQIMDLQPTFCGHVFHSLCLKRWLKVEPFCPICRDPVNPDPFLLPDRIPVNARPTAPETADLSVNMTESQRSGGSSATSILCAICVDKRSAEVLQDHMADNDEDWTEWQDMGLQPTFCGHVFHSLCLDRWLQLDPYCPVCSHIVNPDPFLLPDRIPGK